MVGSLVCWQCGLLVAEGRAGRFYHVEEPPDKWEPHDVTQAIRRADYLLNQQAPTSFMSPIERTARAQERQADALERIATALETRLRAT